MLLSLAAPLFPDFGFLKSPSPRCLVMLDSYPLVMWARFTLFPSSFCPAQKLYIGCAFGFSLTRDSARGTFFFWCCSSPFPLRGLGEGHFPLAFYEIGVGLRTRTSYRATRDKFLLLSFSFSEAIQISFTCDQPLIPLSKDKFMSSFRSFMSTRRPTPRALTAHSKSC